MACELQVSGTEPSPSPVSGSPGGSFALFWFCLGGGLSLNTSLFLLYRNSERPPLTKAAWMVASELPGAPAPPLGRGSGQSSTCRTASRDLSPSSASPAVLGGALGTPDPCVLLESGVSQHPDRQLVGVPFLREWPRHRQAAMIPAPNGSVQSPGPWVSLAPALSQECGPGSALLAL